MKEVSPVAPVFKMGIPAGLLAAVLAGCSWSSSEPVLLPIHRSPTPVTSPMPVPSQTTEAPNRSLAARMNKLFDNYCSQLRTDYKHDKANKVAVPAKPVENDMYILKRTDAKTFVATDIGNGSGDNCRNDIIIYRFNKVASMRRLTRHALFVGQKRPDDLSVVRLDAKARNETDLMQDTHRVEISGYYTSIFATQKYAGVDPIKVSFDDPGSGNELSRPLSGEDSNAVELAISVADDTIKHI